MQIILFILGECLGLHQCAELLVWAALVFCMVFACFLCYHVRKFKHLNLCLPALGYVYAVWWCHSILPKPLPKVWVGKAMPAWIEVVSIPKQLPYGGVMFDARLMRVGNQVQNRTAYVQVRLPGNREVKVGAIYHGCLLFKPLVQLHNPGTADQRQFSYAHAVVAKATVLKDKKWELIDPRPWDTVLLRWRYHCLVQLQSHLHYTLVSSWMPALVLGFADQLSSNDWRILRDTGTAHLMAISGLHVSLVAGMFVVLGSLLYCVFPVLGMRWPKPMLSSALGFIAAVGYGTMAGFSLSVRRCLLMLACYQGTVLCSARKSPAGFLLWSLLLESVWRPVSLLSHGCWLSYGAVALIFYAHHGRCLGVDLWSKWCRMPVIMWVGMMPLLIYFFNQYSLTACIANMVAVPWVSFSVLPLALLGWALSHATMVKSLGVSLLHASAWQLLKLRAFLAFVDHGAWHRLVPYFHINFAIFLCAMVAVLIGLLPGYMPRKYIAALWLLPCVFPQYEVIAGGHFKLTVLDVGQGLSAVVQTAHHSLVYDAGLKFGYMDRGEQVVLPYLAYQGVHAVDMLMISHGDNDHAGGAAAVVQGVKVRQVISSSAKVRASLGGHPCVAGQSWWWDGVWFEVLWPTASAPGHGNNHSCVLRVSAGNHAVLLAGDIERTAEMHMLSHPGLASHLKSDVLIAPHHGSQTSSSPEWLGQIRPSWVVFSTGLLNRYHFPHPQVVLRYRELGTHLLNTAHTGAIEWLVSPDGVTYTSVLRGRSIKPIWA